jgi:hypothetical protein
VVITANIAQLKVRPNGMQIVKTVDADASGHVAAVATRFSEDEVEGNIRAVEAALQSGPLPCIRCWCVSDR